MSVAFVYNKIAQEFSNKRSYQWSWITEYVNNIKSISESTKINMLDIGCGSGRNIKAYMDENTIIKGIDLSRVFVEICTTQGMNVVLGDMILLPFDNDEFDHIMSIASFHHLETEKDRVEALKEMWRVLKPNGTAIMSVWSKTQPEKTKRTFDSYGVQMVSWRSLNGEEFSRYYYIFKLEEIISLIEAVGFTIEKIFWNCGNEVFIIRKNISTKKERFL
jgi:ubiquinone/menaquinone biosynthesis C-methylase UbiE